MRITIFEASGHTEVATVNGLSESRSLHVLKWIQFCLEHEHRDYFENLKAIETEWNKKNPHCELYQHYEKRTTLRYNHYFWSDILDTFGDKWREVSGGNECCLCVAGNLITFFYSNT
jgi:hypothetical protein